jgi:hypothetical protein
MSILQEFFFLFSKIADQEKRGKVLKEEQKKVKDSLTAASKQVHARYHLKRRFPALGVWVTFLKQPDALPGRAPPPKKKKWSRFLIIHIG